ncbi:peptidylprolyl isomerase [bacterium SCSIO 12643]|nr:peptidylprolyl isomerase [bacterium SCSIO 12643]
MYKYFLFAILFMGLFACSSEPKTETVAPSQPKIEKKKETPVKEKVKPQPIKKEYPRITNQNVVQFLTRYGKENKETVIRLTCPYGDIDIKLYNNTPLHRANMIYLTKRGYFDLTQFYRVSKDFVDQAGNSDEWECQEMRAEIGGYTLPAEFNTQNIHKYGAVAMARRYDKNPTKRSSPFEFYITLGRPYNATEIRAHEREFGTSYSDEQKTIYKKIGGTPFLDQQHTVIGEVISGIEVAQELNKVKVDNREWPLTEIPISMKVIR